MAAVKPVIPSVSEQISQSSGNYTYHSYNFKNTVDTAHRLYVSRNRDYPRKGQLPVGRRNGETLSCEAETSPLLAF
jgi:hypothetical protein